MAAMQSLIDKQMPPWWHPTSQQAKWVDHKKKVRSLVKKAGHGTFAVYPNEDVSKFLLVICDHGAVAQFSIVIADKFTCKFANKSYATLKSCIDSVVKTTQTTPFPSKSSAKGITLTHPATKVKKASKAQLSLFDDDGVDDGDVGTAFRVTQQAPERVDASKSVFDGATQDEFGKVATGADVYAKEEAPVPAEDTTTATAGPAEPAELADPELAPVDDNDDEPLFKTQPDASDGADDVLTSGLEAAKEPPAAKGSSNNKDGGDSDGGGGGEAVAVASRVPKASSGGLFDEFEKPEKCTEADAGVASVATGDATPAPKAAKAAKSSNSLLAEAANDDELDDLLNDDDGLDDLMASKPKAKEAATAERANSGSTSLFADEEDDGTVGADASDMGVNDIAQYLKNNK